MPPRADGFDAKTTKTLRDRACGICSRPTCNRLTMGPHTNPLKAKINGVAAHICAAQTGGPRFDVHQTPEQRRSIQNGIWLCSQCAAEIDKDPARYPVATLLTWRQAHETAVDAVGTLGHRRAFLRSRPSGLDRSIAKKVLWFLDNRRVIQDQISNETPAYVLRSVERIRRELHGWRSRLEQGSELEPKLRLMRQACIALLDDAGLFDSNERIGQNLASHARLIAELGAFRKVMMMHVGDIAAKYQLDLPPELAAVVPA